LNDYSQAAKYRHRNCDCQTSRRQISRMSPSVLFVN
jgi:hypothetical protein